MAAEVPLEYSLVIKILEEYKHKNSLKKFLKETNLIDEYKNNRIENVNFISLDLIKKSVNKSIMKCSSIGSLGIYKPISKEERGSQAPEEKSQNVVSNPVAQKAKKPRKRNRASNATKDYSNVENKGDTYAAKAASDLENVRGKQFRNEKNKKKKSSWKGSGSISTGINSTVFEDSD